MGYKKGFDQNPRGDGQQGIGRTQLQNQKAGPRNPVLAKQTKEQLRNKPGHLPKF